jgi:predicted ATPase
MLVRGARTAQVGVAALRYAARAGGATDAIGVARQPGSTGCNGAQRSLSSLSSSSSGGAATRAGRDTARLATLAANTQRRSMFSTDGRSTRSRRGTRSSSSSSSSSSSLGSDGSSGSNGGPLGLYEDMVRRNTVNSDPNQVEALELLQRLHGEIAHAVATGTEPALSTAAPAAGSASSASSSGWSFSSLFGSGDATPSAPTPAGPRGVYLWGGVGCGKTFIMDLLFDAAPTPRKRRAHFHSFMLDIHRRTHALRQGGLDGDPIPLIAADLADDAWLLCFDEFQVTDVADALIMRRLFEEMLRLGVVMVATSNRPPEDLYKNGVQRDHFVPFIATLQSECDVFGMESHTDYRLVKGMDVGQTVMLHPLEGGGGDGGDGEGSAEGVAARAQYDALWAKMTEGATTSAATLVALGHEIAVPEAAHQRNTARFAFGDLCSKALGAADYLAVAKAYHTVFIHGAPVLRLDVHGRDTVRRFITLVDTLYDANVKLVLLAAAPPLQLFAAPPQRADGSTFDEVFAFDRTVSRLVEMNSAEYLERPVKVLTGPEFLKQIEVQRLTDAVIRRVWDRYDTNGSGDLDREELRACMEDVTEMKVGHRNVPDSAVGALFASLDADGNGAVEWPEFQAAARKHGLGYADVWALKPQKMDPLKRTNWIPGVSG